MVETYGVVAGQVRVREWLPALRTQGQRVVLGALLCFVGRDGCLQPTYGQVAELVAMHPSSVRRIVGQLEEIGALMRVGERPVLDSTGIAKGGRVIIWSIPKCASKGAGGDTSQARPTAIPSAPYNGAKRASEGAPLKVEKLRAADCRHFPADESGYCTACGSENVFASTGVTEVTEH